MQQEECAGRYLHDWDQMLLTVEGRMVMTDIHTNSLVKVVALGEVLRQVSSVLTVHLDWASYLCDKERVV